MGHIYVGKYIRRSYGIDIESLSYPVVEAIYDCINPDSLRKTRKAVDKFMRNELGMHKLTLFSMVRDYILIQRAYKNMMEEKDDHQQ